MSGNRTRNTCLEIPSTLVCPLEIVTRCHEFPPMPGTNRPSAAPGPLIYAQPPDERIHTSPSVPPAPSDSSGERPPHTRGRLREREPADGRSGKSQPAVRQTSEPSARFHYMSFPKRLGFFGDTFNASPSSSRRSPPRTALPAMSPRAPAPRAGRPAVSGWRCLLSFTKIQTLEFRKRPPNPVAEAPGTQETPETQPLSALCPLSALRF